MQPIYISYLLPNALLKLSHLNQCPFITSQFQWGWNLGMAQLCALCSGSCEASVKVLTRALVSSKVGGKICFQDSSSCWENSFSHNSQLPSGPRGHPYFLATWSSPQVFTQRGSLLLQLSTGGRISIFREDLVPLMRDFT